ncbi:MAG: hypothetical protein JSS81_14515 [Acidobacteria bacterium]|nr:hypothetical protein [Acidobacteriota bacterium]
MKKLFILLSLLFFSVAAAFAQNEKPPCPTLAISGGGVTNPGEQMMFTAYLGGDTADLNIRYRWTVTQGKIIEGQGTPSIKVDMTDPDDLNITATVEVAGLPAGCPNTASETGSVIIEYRATLIDEFGRLSGVKVRARIEAAYRLPNTPPRSIIYIMNYGTDKEIAAREKQLRRAIALLKYDASRITIVRGGGWSPNGAGVWTKFWLVPPGAENPQP